MNGLPSMASVGTIKVLKCGETVLNKSDLTNNMKTDYFTKLVFCADLTLILTRIKKVFVTDLKNIFREQGTSKFGIFLKIGGNCKFQYR